jgi:hypothetical protein
MMNEAYNLKNLPKPTPRPKLAAENVVQYLDWLMHACGHAAFRDTNGSNPEDVDRVLANGFDPQGRD